MRWPVAAESSGCTLWRWKSAARPPYDRGTRNESPGGDTMARAIAVLGASNTGKSTLVDRMCGLEGQPQPAAAPGELRVARVHPARRDLAGDRHARLDRAPARRHRRAARGRRGGGLRRAGPGGGGAGLALPARGRGRRNAGGHLHQPHRRGRPGRCATSWRRCRTTRSIRSCCGRCRSARASGSSARSTSSRNGPGPIARAGRPR